MKDFHGCWVEAGSLFLAIHFSFQSLKSFSFISHWPLVLPSVAHILLALFLGANHGAEELRRSGVARAGGLQGNVPSLVSEGENPGVGRGQHE